MKMNIGHHILINVRGAKKVSLMFGCLDILYTNKQTNKQTNKR